MKNWQPTPIDTQLFELALKEDLGEGLADVTTQALFANQNDHLQAHIVSKQQTAITIAGLPIVNHLCQQLDPDCQLITELQDGDSLPPGKTLLTLKAKPLTLLTLERTLLNFLQRLSAIATLTHQFVAQTAGTNLKILDTRKTTPGHRHLEKYAVRCGGGVNHRMGLYDAFMIKDTHVDLVGSMNTALDMVLTQNINQLPVIVEVRNLDELKLTLDLAADRINRVLLDNMSPDDLSNAVKLCKNQVETEASGNITLATIKSIAQTGVDFASVGCITHSAGSIDLSMKIF